MKIPLDFFLRLMQNFLNDIELKALAEKFDDFFEVEEDDYTDILKGVSFKEIITSYIIHNEKLKNKIKAKVKKLQTLDNEEDDQNEEKKKKSKTNKKKQRGKKGANHKKKEYEDDDDDDEDEDEDEEDNEEKERTKPIKKKKMESKPKTQQNEESNEEIDLSKLNFQSGPKQNLNPERKPFKRIDDSIRESLPEALKDNSYEAFMKKTGDSFGQEANDKLKFTRGKDFKKEKGKFKNKSSAGTYAISTTVRSIPLDDASD